MTQRLWLIFYVLARSSCEISRHTMINQFPDACCTLNCCLVYTHYVAHLNLHMTAFTEPVLRSQTRLHFSHTTRLSPSVLSFHIRRLLAGYVNDVLVFYGLKTWAGCTAVTFMLISNMIMSWWLSLKMQTWPRYSLFAMSWTKRKTTFEMFSHDRVINNLQSQLCAKNTLGLFWVQHTFLMKLYIIRKQ